MAETWAAGCDWRHGQPTLTDDVSAPFNAIGQNLYMTTARTIELGAGIQAWYDEKSDYDYDAQTCADGRVCGHYTQVCGLKLDFRGSSFLVAPSRHPRENVTTMLRGCYEETATVEFQLYVIATFIFVANIIM